MSQMGVRRAKAQDGEAIDAFKKNFYARVEEIRSSLAPDTPVEVWFQDEIRVGQKNKLTYFDLGQNGIAAAGCPRSPYALDLPIRCRVS